MRKIALLFVVFLLSTFYVSAQNSLDAFDAEGKQLNSFPLKHTDVKVEISGFLARVNVAQEFENNFTNPVEAVYVFPLSQNSAVDAMTMKIGTRTIRGQIMKREEAKEVYEAAKAQGKRAALLDQERLNIFTQSVANIQPGEKILIEISYVEILKFEDGEYEFVFPMMIGERYSPRSENPAETQKTSPPIAQTRNGSDISIEVKLDAGVPVEAIRSPLHEIETVNLSPKAAKINLKNLNTIPNKDFILRYDVTGKEIKDAILTHKDERGGFFTLILSPPQDFGVRDITPKEIVFVLDTSGSMSGFPIEKAKEAMRLSLEGLNPNDTFNLITFAGETSVLFEKPVQATPENLRQAQMFLASKQSSGGTEMMKAIRAAFAPSASKKHLRIVCFMTDGYVTNEAEIIAEVQKHPEARVFAFGIGNSVNRYLLDKIASEGLGDVEYVSLADDGEKAARRFYERVRSPLLTDLSIDWNGLPVEDIYPKRIGDLFSAKPLIISGRFKESANGTIKLKGKVGGQVYERGIAVNFPENEPKHDVLATLWARKKIDELMMENLKAATVEEKAKIKDLIIELGINYRLLTDHTSFVAVEDSIITENGKSTTVSTPLQSSGNFRTGSDPYGFSFQITAGRRNSSDPRNTSPQMANAFADVVDLELSTTVNGNRVILGDSPQTENNLRGNDSNNSTDSGNSNAVLDEILKRMETQRKNLTSLRADVKMTSYASRLDESETSEGSAIYLFSNSGRSMFRVDWTKPKESIFSVVNNKYLIYNPRMKTAFTGIVNDKELNSFGFINFSSEEIKNRYQVKYIGGKKLSDGTSAWHLELTPKNITMYKSVELWIDANGTVIQTKIVEKNDDYILIRLSNLRKNEAIKATEFKIELPKDTKITNNN